MSTCKPTAPNSRFDVRARDPEDTAIDDSIRTSLSTPPPSRSKSSKSGTASVLVEQFADDIRKGRSLGLSWAQIGEILGRRFPRPIPAATVSKSYSRLVSAGLAKPLAIKGPAKIRRAAKQSCTPKMTNANAPSTPPIKRESWQSFDD